RVDRQRPAEQAGRRAGIAWRTARILPRDVLGDVLARGAARRGCRASGVATASRPGNAIPVGLAGAGMAAVRAGAAQAAALRAAVDAIMLWIAVPGAIVPLLRPLFPSALLAYNIHPDCERPLFASAGYHEPSLVFLFGTSTRLTNGQGAADFLLEGDCRFAFVEARHERAFVQRAEAIGLRYAPGPRVEGINYTAGHS